MYPWLPSGFLTHSIFVFWILFSSFFYSYENVARSLPLGFSLFGPKRGPGFRLGPPCLASGSLEVNGFLLCVGSLNNFGFLRDCGSLPFNGFLILPGALPLPGFSAWSSSLPTFGFLIISGSLQSCGFLLVHGSLSADGFQWLAHVVWFPLIRWLASAMARSLIMGFSLPLARFLCLVFSAFTDSLTSFGFLRLSFRLGFLACFVHHFPRIQRLVIQFYHAVRLGYRQPQSSSPHQPHTYQKVLLHQPQCSHVQVPFI